MIREDSIVWTGKEWLKPCRWTNTGVEEQTTEDAIQSLCSIETTDAHMWMGFNPHDPGAIDIWAAALAQSFPGLEESPAQCLRVMHVPEQHTMCVATTQSLTEVWPLLWRLRDRVSCATWKRLILSEGPWEGINKTVAWEMYFQKEGYSPHAQCGTCLLYTSPSPRDATLSRMPSSA